MSMNNKTFGQKVGELRRSKGMTQEALADRLGVSAQAVSKWETDVSMPDVSLLPALAEQLGCSIDTLFDREERPDVELVEPAQRKDPGKMIMRVLVDSSSGDHVRVNLPLAFIQGMVNATSGMKGVELGGVDLSGIDFAQLLSLAEQGVVGRFVEVDSADGDHVIIEVE